MSARKEAWIGPRDSAVVSEMEGKRGGNLNAVAIPSIESGIRPRLHVESRAYDTSRRSTYYDHWNTCQVEGEKKSKGV